MILDKEWTIKICFTKILLRDCKVKIILQQYLRVIYESYIWGSFKKFCHALNIKKSTGLSISKLIVTYWGIHQEYIYAFLWNYLFQYSIAVYLDSCFKHWQVSLKVVFISNKRQHNIWKMHKNSIKFQKLKWIS